MKKIKLRIVYIVAIALIMGGCRKSNSSNRDLVLRYVNEHKESIQNEEVYAKLAEVIREVEEDALKKETTNILKPSKSSEVYEKSSEARAMGVDFILEAGLYVARRDFPSGKYKIGFKTPNHGMYCKEIITNNRIQPGNMQESDGMFWYTCELTSDALVKIDSKAYMILWEVTDSVSNSDMGGESYTNLGEIDLLWLGKAGKKPNVTFTDWTFIKRLSGTVYAIQHDGGLAAIDVGNDNELGKDIQAGNTVELSGQLTGYIQAGKRELGVVKVR